MAAAAATLTAVPRCRKRDAADIAAAVTGTSPNKAKRGRPPPEEEEVEAFLAAAESGLARRFATKYNYDVAKDAPMDGRYEWVRMGP